MPTTIEIDLDTQAIVDRSALQKKERRINELEAENDTLKEQQSSGPYLIGEIEFMQVRSDWLTKLLAEMDDFEMKNEALMEETLWEHIVDELLWGPVFWFKHRRKRKNDVDATAGSCTSRD